MANIKIVYDSEDEVEDIIKHVEKFIDLNSSDNNSTKNYIQVIIQKAFDEGRKFQKQLGNSQIKDSS